MILDCLIDRMKCKEDLLDLCDQLDRLTSTSPELMHLINELRKGTYIYVTGPEKKGSTQNTPIHIMVHISSSVYAIQFL